jgi:hypothetical protein
MAHLKSQRRRREFKVRGDGRSQNARESPSVAGHWCYESLPGKVSVSGTRADGCARERLQVRRMRDAGVAGGFGGQCASSLTTVACEWNVTSGR